MGHIILGLEEHPPCVHRDRLHERAGVAAHQGEPWPAPETHREADDGLGGDNVGHPGVLHAVVPQLLPLVRLGQVDGVEARAGLGGEAVEGEEPVQGEGGVEGQLAGLEDVKGLERPGLDLTVREAPGGVEEGDVEPDAVEGAEFWGGVEVVEEGLSGAEVGVWVLVGEEEGL